jgi:ParB family chromosome partitioning protein
VGRDRWIGLADRLENAAALDKARELIGEIGFGLRPSDERFEVVLSASSLKRVRAPRPKFWKAEDGTRIVQIKDDPRRVTLAIDKKATGAFGSYLIERLPEIYAAFKRHEDK